MHFYIDGYNLLFRLFHSEKKFETQRELLISYLQEKVKHLNHSITVVFDGCHQNEDLSNRAYYDHLSVIFTKKKQTADEYIIDQISHSNHPSKQNVVTNDNNLSFQCKSLGAKAHDLDTFLDFLDRKEKKSKQKSEFEMQDAFVDSKKNINRLLKIFEQRLNEDEN